LKGTSLVLYFDPGDGKDTRPFVFEPKGKSSAQETLIEVKDGNLDIVGVEFRMPRKDFIPAHAIHVTRGNLRMHHCKLYGPQPQHPPEHHKSLIRVEKSPPAPLDDIKVGPPAHNNCVFDECVFVTTGTVAELAGSELHVRMQGCLAVAGQELLKLDFSSIMDPRLNVHCWLEQNSIAARGAVLQIEDSKKFDVPLEPAICGGRGNVFWSPFVEINPVRPSHSGLLWCQPDTLVHGTFLWFGEDNVYDKRLHFVFAAPDSVPKTAQPLDFWRFLWSCDRDILQIYEGKPPPQVDFSNPRSVENLYLPAEAIPRDPPPGADLVKLGLKKSKGS
jgi:hypothetical protein